MIQAREIVVRSPAGTALLDGVSVSLVPGAVLAILGPNGAGKTTLLRVLSGTLRPHGGAVTLDGRPLSSFARVALARRRAVLGQHQTLEFALAAADVVALGRLPFAGTAEARDDADAVAAARDSFALGGLWRRPYPSLSGGERQRVQLARAAAQLWRRSAGGPARALLLDEPTAALDLTQQQAALQAARGWAGQGVAVAEILHDLNQAAQADQALLLRGGRVVAAGSVETVLRPDILEDCFGVRVETVTRADGRLGFLAN